jgi:hypothetical protein
METLFIVNIYNMSWKSLELYFFFFFFGNEAWTQGLHLESLHQPCCSEGFFKIGSRELLAQADF